MVNTGTGTLRLYGNGRELIRVGNYLNACGFDRPRAASKHWFFAMPLFFFRIRNGPFSGVADCGAELADPDAAWTELTAMCADLVGGIARQLQQNTEWQMELLDESKKPVFRIRLLAETMETFATD